MRCSGTGRAAVLALLLSTAGGLLAGCGGTATPTGGDSPRTVARGQASPTPVAQGAATADCGYTQLVASAAQQLPSSTPKGTWAVRVPLVNDGPQPCVLKGFPTVALAGQGSPERNRPLKVTTEGVAHPVQLAVGGRAWVRLTFRQVLGEADGYCPSGATPLAAPSLVLGVGGGKLQLGMEGGGNFAECDDTVRTTAFLATRP
ncbi:DUF4232 domain-containing protein [Peterkaempfera sp. SMS 1(5)a]|uniref:DUF4232 domain-containing protein n=1 Tax=Peterkaempfera podocarpi TaxID=3232308 RepID=UPI00366C8DD4